MDDRRHSERLNLASPLSGEVTVVQSTRILQLATDGMQVETDVSLQLNSLHEFRLPLNGQWVVIKGRVAHARISDVDREHVTYLSGVEFVEVPEHARARIAAFLADVRQMRLSASSGR